MHANNDVENGKVHNNDDADNDEVHDDDDDDDNEEVHDNDGENEEVHDDNDDDNASECNIFYLPDLEKVVDVLYFSAVPHSRLRDGSREI
eukprot:15366921-Ditylum_brightwellii.AAC.1